jgi:hypothetical protein
MARRTATEILPLAEILSVRQPMQFNERRAFSRQKWPPRIHGRLDERD